MRVLVTGGSGYIGSRLMEALSKADEVEEIVDVDVRGPARAIHKVRHERRSVAGDLTDLFRGPARPVDVALHLAWTVDPLRDAAAQRDICIGGTNRFLDGCVAGNVRHVLFVSSATAYGANPAHARPVDESEPLKDRWHFQYSAEKREAEGLMRRFAADRPGTLLQIVRPCIVGGPNVSNFISRNAERPFVMRVLGHDPMLQLVHEDDCAAAVVAIVRSRVPGAFNVAAEGGITLTEVARRAGVPVVALPFGLLARAADLGWRRGLRWITEAPPEFLWFMVHPWLVSAERLRRDVGFRFAFTAEQTLGQMLERLGSRRGG